MPRSETTQAYWAERLTKHRFERSPTMPMATLDLIGINWMKRHAGRGRVRRRGPDDHMRPRPLSYHIPGLETPPYDEPFRHVDRLTEYQRGLQDGIKLAAEAANGIEPSLLNGMSERYVSIYCTARRDASDLIKSLPSEPCEYCGNGKLTGLPGNACESCMNTGLKYPELAGVAEQSGAGAPETSVRCGAPAAKPDEAAL